MILGKSCGCSVLVSQGNHSQSSGGNGNIDCGHDSLHNAEVITDDLGKEGEEVWDAGDITGDVGWVEVLLMIPAHPNSGKKKRQR